MEIEVLDDGIAIRTPAKLNLYLEVLSKRADGYHEIDTLMCPINLFDEMTFHPNDTSQIQLEVDTEDGLFGNGRDPAWQIPSDRRNLVVRALEITREHVGSRQGCLVRLKKRIPAAAGLGGGSSNAASSIVAGLCMWASWDRATAYALGAQLGSDIPLFFGDAIEGIGLVRATGRGELIERVAARPPLAFVVSHPPVGCSTAEVYKGWRPASQVGDTFCNQEHPTRFERMKRACELGELNSLENQLFNSLQTPASKLTDWIPRQLELFAEAGKPISLMTGSGSACFALVDSPQAGATIATHMIELGLPRAYSAQAWYATSIEQQLEQHSR